LFTQGWWRGGPYHPADVNSLIIINTHKALKLWTKLMVMLVSCWKLKKKSQEQESKRNTQPTGTPGNDVVPVLHKMVQLEV
jgi:hypothetical protein